MAISVVMPALEMAQETGKLISWLKKEGEPVAKGEPLLEIETDKAVMEIESPGDGILAGVKAQARRRSAGGSNHRVDRAPGRSASSGRSGHRVGKKDDNSPQSRNVASANLGSPVEQSVHSNARISPKARRLASRTRCQSCRRPWIGSRRRNSRFRHTRCGRIQDRRISNRSRRQSAPFPG